MNEPTWGISGPTFLWLYAAAFLVTACGVWLRRKGLLNAQDARAPIGTPDVSGPRWIVGPTSDWTATLTSTAPLSADAGYCYGCELAHHAGYGYLRRGAPDALREDQPGDLLRNRRLGELTAGRRLDQPPAVAVAV